jgi:hypothetical protein
MRNASLNTIFLYKHAQTLYKDYVINVSFLNCKFRNELCEKTTLRWY